MHCSFVELCHRRILFYFRFQNRRAKWRKREKALGRESPNFIGAHDLDAFRHQMSTYLSNAAAVAAAAGSSGTSTERTGLAVPPPHYLPFLMGHLDEKVLPRVPVNSTAANFGLLYHHHQQQHPSQAQQPNSHSNQTHPGNGSNLNVSSASPSSTSSSSSDIHESNSPYLGRFDDPRRLKLEIQDATA